MSNAQQIKEKKPAYNRLNRKIAKHVKVLDRSRPMSPSNIDHFLVQCFSMHKTLEKSSRLLSRFTEELRHMSVYLNDVRRDEMLECDTVWNEDEDVSVQLNHREFFHMLDNHAIPSEEESLEQWIERNAANGKFGSYMAKRNLTEDTLGNLKDTTQQNVALASFLMNVRDNQ